MTDPMSQPTGPAQPRSPIYQRGPSWLAPVVAIIAIIAVGIGANLAQDGGNNTPASEAQAPTSTVAGSPTTTVAGPTTTQATTSTTVTAPATTVPTLAGTGTLPAALTNFTQGAWKVTAYDDLNKDPIVRDWIKRLKNPDPARWETFPNEPNKKLSNDEFRVVPCADGVKPECVPDGLYYGVDNVPFCQQDMRCDFVVPARHYRLITADYAFQNLTCSQGANRQGCLLFLLNVGGETMSWRNQMADGGFTVAGPFFNGDKLEVGTWGGVSHASANMLNMSTKGMMGEALNAGGTNSGANCGVPEGCNSVLARVVIHAGDRVLAVLETTVTR